MSRQSFIEDLIIDDEEIARKIAAELQEPSKHDIVASQPPTLPEDANAIWFHGHVTVSPRE